MFLIKPSFEILNISAGNQSLKLIELAGRTCYKSEEKITDDSAEDFVRMLNKRGHHSVIEHSSLTVKFICDRGVSHEIVRHRLASYSQESTRYCNYKGGVTYILPPWITSEWLGEWEAELSEQGDILAVRNGELYYKVWPVKHFIVDWLCTLLRCETCYKQLLVGGWSPQQARSVLPNSLKTEIVMTANFREWQHVLKLRCGKAAHPQIREVMIPLLQQLKTIIPALFDNII